VSVRSRLASILLLAVMILSLTAPAVQAAIPEPDIEAYATNNAGMQVGVPLSPSGVPVYVYGGKDPEVASKLDKALLDTDYVKQITRYSDIYKASYETVSGKSIPFEPSGLLVTLDSMDSLPQLEEIISSFNGVIVKTYPQINTIVVAFPADVNVIGKAAYKIAEAPFVKRVYLDKLASPQMFDTIITTGAYQIWQELGVNGSGVLVAVLDTGVDPTHPSIPDPLYWADFINGLDVPYDDHGHGTHVAGTILGRGGQVFETGTGVWHTVIVGENSVYNYPGPANFTYAINVSMYQGWNITIEFEHFYGLNLSMYNLPYGYDAYAYVLAKFDNSSWMVLDMFEGNINMSMISAYNLTVPADAEMLYLSFVLFYNIYTFVSVPGWFINYVAVYNATDPAQLIFYDDVSTMTPPPELINSYLWLRTSNTFYGIAPGADLAAGKVCSGFGGCPVSAILAGMEWAATIGADIVSMSLGGPAFIYDTEAMMADWLVSQGIVVVIAAGNEGPYYYTVGSPGISHKAITVGAATKINTYGFFSSAGPSPADFYVKPDISAPGLGIISAVPLWYAADPELLPWGSYFPYESWMGTSMATPHVSGVAALIIQAHPDWTPEMVKSAIISTGDWLYPSAWMPYQFDIYRQGGGMVDPVQAINTPMLPLEANIFVGKVYRGVNETISFNITLVNIAATEANITVVRTDLFAINVSQFPPQYFFYQDLVQEPVYGDSWIIPPGGELNVTVTINLSRNDLVLAPYGGHVEFLINGTEPIHVIFGFPLLTYIYVKGIVFDYFTGEPVPGAYVLAWDLLLENRYAVNVTDADGFYMVKVPSNHTARIIVIPPPGHYGYFGYAFWTPSGDLIYNIPLVPEVAEPTILVWVEPDPTEWPAKSVEAILAAAEEVGIPAILWDARILGSPYFAVVSGHFPLVVYLSGGDWSPLADIPDFAAMIEYSTTIPGTIVLSGGDIGWFWAGSSLMYYVAHAEWMYDLMPDTYEASVYKTPLTWTLFGLVKYLEYMDAPLLSDMNETIVVNKIDGYYPDIVVPVNNGTYMANWTFLPMSAAVWYNGTGNEPAKSVYFAFDLEQLDDDILYGIAKRLIAFAFDTSAPEPTGEPIDAQISRGSLIIFPEGSYTDDVYVEYYYAILYYENWTPITTVLPNEAGIITISRGELGLDPGIYRVELVAVDLLGNSSSQLNMTWNVVPGLAKGILAVVSNDTVLTVDIAEGVILEVNASAPATLQFGQLRSITALTGSNPPGVSGKHWQLPLDLFVDESTPGAVESITIVVKVPLREVTIDPRNFKAYWFNGTAWVEFSAIELKADGTITIHINQTTTPSISDLGGTPLLLALPPAIIGGEITLEAGASPAPLLALAVGLALLAGGLAARRQRH